MKWDSSESNSAKWVVDSEGDDKMGESPAEEPKNSDVVHFCIVENADGGDKGDNYRNYEGEVDDEKDGEVYDAVRDEFNKDTDEDAADDG
jgi:hypothetical protein